MGSNLYANCFITDSSRIMTTFPSDTDSSSKNTMSQKGSTTVATTTVATTVASVFLNSSISAGIVIAIVVFLLILTASIFAVLLGIMIWQKRKTSSQTIVKGQFNGKGVGMSFYLFTVLYE